MGDQLLIYLPGIDLCHNNFRHRCNSDTLCRWRVERERVYDDDVCDQQTPVIVIETHADLACQDDFIYSRQ